MPKQPQFWSPAETVIAVYFISRQFEYRSNVASEVIKMRLDKNRDPGSCTRKVINVRKDFYNPQTKTYNLYLAGAWLSHQMPDTAELERLIGIKDGKIVDEKVMEILKKYV